MSEIGWDGHERRAAVILADDLKTPRATVDAPIVMVLVGFAAVLLMQAASIWSHGLILARMRASEDFRAQVTCYIVHSTQGETGPTVLTTCGFLTLGAPPK